MLNNPPRCPESHDGHQCVYVANHTRTRYHFNAQVGRWHAPAEELQLALTRYERLCSPPRWMLVPIVPSIDAAERARDHCIDIGRDAKAAEIEYWLDAEWRRRELLAQWSGEPASMVRGIVPRELAENWKGRTLYAWSELHSRLCQARDNAVSAGILDRRGQAYVAVSDRIRDVEHRCRVAWRRQTRGEPAVA